MRRLLLLFAATLLAFCSFAQTYIEPFAGYQADVKNKNFNQFLSGVQVSFHQGKSYELIIRVQKALPVSHHSADSSYTLNTSLPLYAKAAKTIRPDAWYFSLDHRFVLNPRNKKFLLSVLLHSGFSFQNVSVSYQYDKGNYTILNPDQSQRGTGVVVGTGLELMHLIKTNRLFFQLTIDAAPWGANIQSPSSFSFMAPLAFRAGYSILFKKKKHEK